MTDKPKRTDLEIAEELYAFLQGKVPDGVRIAPDHVPKLTADQAWTVVHYLGNLYRKISDYIERCDVCGEVHDSNSEGACLDYGDSPYHFCEGCTWLDEYQDKAKEDPNREQEDEDEA